MPEVSVIMPVRNAEAFVGRAIQSIVEQTYRDFEFIILDDASTDGTRDVIRSFADRRIRLIQSPSPQGVARLLNQGLDMAAGRYVARMDADDVSFPDRLGRQVAFLQAHGHIGICGSWVRCVGQRRPYLLTWPTGPDAVRAFLLFGNPLAHPTVCLRADLVNQFKLRYDESIQAAQDYEFWIRCSERLVMDNIPEVLLRYTVHAGSVTQTRQTASGDQAMALIRRQLWQLGLRPDVEEIAFHRWVGLGEGMKSLKDLERVERWLKALLDANAKTRIHPLDALRKAAAFVWFRVCMNSSALGLRVLWRYWRSGLGKGFRPAGAEIGRFAASLVWHTARL